MKWFEEVCDVLEEFMNGYDKDRIQMFHTPSMAPDHYDVLFDKYGFLI